MTAYLVDTDIIVDYMKGRRKAAALLESIHNEGFAISIITYAELYEGVLGSDPARREASERAFRELVSSLDVIHVDAETAERLAAIRVPLRQTGTLIGDFDLLIAATALRHDLTLASRDKHFARVPGLKRL